MYPLYKCRQILLYVSNLNFLTTAILFLTVRHKTYLLSNEFLTHSTRHKRGNYLLMDWHLISRILQVGHHRFSLSLSLCFFLSVSSSLTQSLSLSLCLFLSVSSSLSQSLSLSLSFFLSVSSSLAQSLYLFLFLSVSSSLTQSLYLSLFLSVSSSLSQSHSLSLTLFISLSIFLSPTVSLSLSQFLSLSLFLSHTVSLSLSLSLSHTHTHFLLPFDSSFSLNLPTFVCFSVNSISLCVSFSYQLFQVFQAVVGMCARLCKAYYWPSPHLEERDTRWFF